MDRASSPVTYALSEYLVPHLRKPDIQYTGGQVTFYPTNPDGSLASESASPPLEFDFPYKKGSAPNNERQDKPHAHHVIEDSNGLIYVCDLGSDRVWVIERAGEELKVKGWLQAPEGSGPRHAALSPDGELFWVLVVWNDWGEGCAGGWHLRPGSNWELMFG
jgi:6-phosphogluconolactonase (cycloisomerase 2 family)